MSEKEVKLKSNSKDKTKILYRLKSVEDLINILKVSPSTPIFHVWDGGEHIYTAQTLGDNLFLLKTKKAIPTDLQIPYSGERVINLIELESLEVIGLKDFEKLFKK